MFWYKYIYLQTTDIYPLFLLHHFKSLFFVYEKVYFRIPFWTFLCRRCTGTGISCRTRVCRANPSSDVRQQGNTAHKGEWYGKNQSRRKPLPYRNRQGKIAFNRCRHHIEECEGGRTTRLIVKAKDNATDPQSFISIFKFEVKGKERRYQLAESGTLSKTESNNLSSVDYDAKRYGKNSYYLVLNDLEPGEYGIVIGDPNTENTKNGMKVTTFTVK